MEFDELFHKTDDFNNTLAVGRFLEEEPTSTDMYQCQTFMKKLIHILGKYGVPVEKVATIVLDIMNMMDDNFDGEDEEDDGECNTERTKK